MCCQSLPYIPHNVLPITGLIVGLCPANERRCYFVTTSLIGWSQTKNHIINCAHSWFGYIATLVRCMSGAISHVRHGCFVSLDSLHHCSNASGLTMKTMFKTDCYQNRTKRLLLSAIQRILVRIAFCFVQVWQHFILLIPFNIISLMLGHSYNVPNSSQVTLRNMGEYMYSTWINSQVMIYVFLFYCKAYIENL